MKKMKIKTVVKLNPYPCVINNDIFERMTKEITVSNLVKYVKVCVLWKHFTLRISLKIRTKFFIP